ncbi:histone-fold-containing protein [Yarrowia lipolytica]|jgi:histone H4|uniref:Histone H4 n=2 Tax=Yarrowia lipolytica TaxID=4952 RepID=Q6C3E6_YARLI|nr:YALI0F00374p [Yarrowia lipolytica CLIB122]AOW06434.1 hypothetical protein YALI1_F00436g [Yarrowia lipolytica]KAB8279984.1 histone-fold-containing protein [Yarrowia lipolytica]KAE8168716.1 histone-fold-containing protein [Yarrowia lipolytica]KAJ8056304.1 histone-fold-containing protein [Yarrowia lipolytica]QNQ00460.1 Histone H4 [Yarrowia lipolytica]|eukprot:XP_504816.1 YALI0F00374p [Yarrowia lipolytica CLIB122]
MAGGRGLRKGINKPTIRRLARRGGVKRISSNIDPDSRDIVKDVIKQVLGDALFYTHHARRNTVTGVDVVHALKRQGRPLYGFDA